MSKIPPFRSAWNAEFAASGGLCAYALQALNPGLIQCAALGFHRQCGESALSTEMLAAVGTSLVLFTIDGPDMTLSHICSSPVFSSILDIAFICKYQPDSSTFAQAGDDSLSGVYVVLADDGQLALIGVESVGQCRRLRTIEESRVLTQNDDGSEPRLIRKLVTDPLSRIVAVVSWLDYIEVMPLLHESGASGARQHPQASSERIHISTGGAICDAAILMPAPTEARRILLVAAIMDGERQSHFLYLYEIWSHAMSTARTPSLVAKLPLPFDIAMPLRIIALPAFPEHFVLVTENEVVLGSALQLLSGDIHLYRQPLPRLSNGTSDLVRGCCVAGTISVPARGAIDAEAESKTPLRSPLLSQRTSATASPHMREARSGHELAQKIYISMQSGTLLRISAAPRPLLSLAKVLPEQAGVAPLSPGDVMLYLNHDLPYPSGAAFDYVLLSGDCSANAIVRISAPAEREDDGGRLFSDGSTMTSSDAEPVQWTCPVLENQSPIIDFVLQKDGVYMTGGRADNGSVLRAQLGHATHLLGRLGADSDSEEMFVPDLVAPAWSFCISSPMHARSFASCVVLQHANANVPIVESSDSGWQVHEELRLAVASRRLSFIGNVGADRILCVFRDTVEMARLGVDGCETEVLIGADNKAVFTHGACATTNAGHTWAAVAMQPSEIGPAPRKAILRVLPVAVAGIADGLDKDRALLEIELEHDVSCLRLFATDAGMLLVAGTYEPNLHVYRIDTAAPLLKSLNIPIDLRLSGNGDECMDCTSIGSDNDSASVDAHIDSAISDAYILGSQTMLFILAGLRDGRLVWVAAKVSQLADNLQTSLSLFGAPRCVKTGQVPITFADTSLQAQPSADGVLMLSESLHILCVGLTGQLEITPCSSDCIGRDSFCCIVPLTIDRANPIQNAAAGSDSEFSGMRRFLATSSDGRASILGIEIDARCSISSCPVNAEPRRIVVDQHTGMLVVASVMRVQHPAVGPSLTSCLKVVDPETGRSCAEVQFRPLELVRSLATWHIRGQKSYRYVCVGTAQLTEQGDMQDSVQQQQATGGRLVIYNLKPVKRKSRSRLALSPEVDRMAAVSSAGAPGYELKYVWESDRSGPVSALASLGDAYLVVAVGARCVVLKLDVVQKRLIECCECPLRFAAVSLDICGHDIVVGSTREAVNVLRFTAAEGDSGCDKLEPVYSARFGANTADARFLAADLVAGVDHSGFVFVAGLPVKSAEFGLDFALGMHLGTECTRLRVGQMVQRLDLPEHVLAWSRSANDSSDNRSAGCIVISTLSGGMWTIARISDDAFALLRRLELAMLAMPPLHPARPLFAASGSINRARNTSRIQPTGIVDGSLSATFVQHLTTAERIEVVDSSPDLMQAALAVAERSILGPCPAAPDPHTTAAEFVARLVHDLSRVSIC